MSPSSGASHSRELHDAFDSDHMIEALEVEASLARPVLEEAALTASRWLAAAGVTPQRILDLGCGPGVGTVQLAETFPSASVVGVDASSPMLARAAGRASASAHAARIEFRGMDLDADLAPLGRADLVVAAMAIHHVADEVATLRNVRTLIEPSGALCMLERGDPISARLAEDLGRPGIWQRVDAAWRLWFEANRQHLPGAPNADRWAQLLAAAGFELLEVRPLGAIVDGPDDAATARFAMQQLRRTVVELDGRADAADLAALRQHLDHLEAHPDDATRLAIKVTRTLFIARAA